MGNKVYWKGPEELHQTPEFLEAQQNEFPAEMSVDEFLGDDRLKETSTGRRDFLKFLGFSLTAATLASCETPVIKSIPYLDKPEDITPGVATWYASSYYDGNDFGSVLVKTREGRPIHIKGNPLSGLTKGTVNSRINSSVLSLYDSTRLQGPKGAVEGEMAWHDVDAKIKARLEQVGTGEIAVLSNTIISPSTRSAIEHFAAKYAGGVMDDNAGAASDTTTVDAGAAAAHAAAHAEGNFEPGPGTFRHVSYDAVSNNGITEANNKTFNKAVIPAYDFSKAKVIVSIGADFCANWLLSTQYIKDYGTTRRPDGDWMSRHFQFETIMSITGANADVRRAIKPSEEGKVAAALLSAVGGNAGVDASGLAANVQSAIETAAAELKANGGNCLVVAGSNNAGVQMVVNQINSILGNYGSTIDLDNHLNIKQGKDAAVAELIADMNAGKISALFVYGSNPAWNLPDAKGFKDGLAVMREKGQLTVSTSMHNDETGSLCEYICPDNHYLESWNDLEPAVGTFALVQPTISNLYDTRQAQESFLRWGGMDYAFDDVIKMYWEHKIYPASGYTGDFTAFWNESLHNGGFQKEKAAATNPTFLGLSGASEMIGQAAALASGAYEVALYTKTGIGDGSQSGNPWLHELPDPISKVTWDNYITMSPADIRENLQLTNATLGIVSDAVYVIGQEWHASLATIVVNGVEMKLPIFPQPGQARGTIGIALGYGREGGAANVGKAAYQYGRYGENIEDENGNHVAVGQNAFPMVAMAGGTASYSNATASLTVLEEKYEMACTQTHHTMMGRTSVIRETTADVYDKGHGDKNEYNPIHAIAFHENGQDHAVQKPVDEIDLWDAHPVEKVGHRWGMSIDLTTCLGCGSCITACNSENNVPVVGKDEVRRVREMHWLRLDRYYTSDEDVNYDNVKENHEGSFDYSLMEVPSDQPEVVFMPMMCQHCNHAPCETVCPVAATTHSNEGLNQMTYNRCIGTRYCANNCPFKVRRFNWFNYNGYKKFTNVNPAQDDMGRMVLNPDVVVRSRGVMEKCSLCVQQIQAGKLQAKKESRAVNDGEIQTACASACPTHAITFGDLNDTHSEVAENADDSRAYRALEEVGVQPNIYYMTKVRNKSKEEA